jgi:hypothetical protein
MWPENIQYRLGTTLEDKVRKVVFTRHLTYFIPHSATIAIIRLETNAYAIETNWRISWALNIKLALD